MRMMGCCYIPKLCLQGVLTRIVIPFIPSGVDDSDGSDSGFSQPKRIFTGTLLSPAALHISSPSSQLVQQVHHNNLRLGLDMNAARQHTSR